MLAVGSHSPSIVSATTSPTTWARRRGRSPWRRRRSAVSTHSRSYCSASCSALFASSSPSCGTDEQAALAEVIAPPPPAACREAPDRPACRVRTVIDAEKNKRHRYIRAVFGPKDRRFPKRDPEIEELLRRSLEIERSAAVLLLSARGRRRSRRRKTTSRCLPIIAITTRSKSGAGTASSACCSLAIRSIEPERSFQAEARRASFCLSARSRPPLSAQERPGAARSTVSRFGGAPRREKAERRDAAKR
jgi:hypothetical protein